MKNILIISFFNSSNVGDKAIGEVLIREMKKFANVRLMDISGKPVAVSSPQCSSVAPVKKCRFYTLKSMVSLHRPGRLAYAESMIKDSDYILIAGGNMIMDMERFSYYSYLCDRYVCFAKRLRKKVGFVFIGTGKVRTFCQMKRWKHALQNSDFISVRDSFAKEMIAEQIHCTKEVHVWKDPVFLLESSRDKVYNGTIAINVYLNSVSSLEDREQLKSAYIYLIQNLQKKYTVVMYATEKHDFGDLDEIYDSLSDPARVRIAKPETLIELIHLYKTVDMVIATRMHPFIIATTQNLPAIILSWDKKIDGMIHDIGLSNRSVEIHEAYAQKEKILALSETIMENHMQSNCDIYRINMQIKAELNAYFEQLKRIVEAE